jgi:hypothetical protein
LSRQSMVSFPRTIVVVPGGPPPPLLGSPLVALTQVAVGMTAVVERQHPQASASALQDWEEQYDSLEEMYRAAADGRFTLALEHLLVTLNRTSTGARAASSLHGDKEKEKGEEEEEEEDGGSQPRPCFAYFQLDGDDAEDVAGDCAAHPLAYAMGFESLLPPRTASCDHDYNHNQDSRAGSSATAVLKPPGSFLKPIGAAAEQIVLSEAFRPHLQRGGTRRGGELPTDKRFSGGVVDVVRAVVVCDDCQQMVRGC